MHLLALLAACAGSDAARAAADHPDIVYLNRCAAGCTVAAGPNDAINGMSNLVSGTNSVAAFPGSDTVFDETAACVRHALLPFNIHVIANNPGSLPRREIMLTTTATQIGYSSGLRDLSNYDGLAHDNYIAFVFASAIGSTAVDQLCQSAAQQIGFLYGIEHVTGNCLDIEDNVAACGEKSFTNQASACLGGVFNDSGKCILGNTTQNSYAAILAIATASDFIFANSLEAFEVPHAGPSP
jgi:hypothetical protein